MPVQKQPLKNIVLDILVCLCVCVYVCVLMFIDFLFYFDFNTNTDLVVYSWFIVIRL